MTAVLDFAMLDGLAFAAERGRLSGRAPNLVAHDLGPVVELGQLAAAGLLPSPDRAEWLQLDGLSVLCRAIVSGRVCWVCPDGRRIGFLRTGAKPPADETVWTGFGLAAQQAAVASGFSTRIAAQLVAAIGEMRSNVYEHSGAASTGLIAFRAAANRFELVVADQGMGVLESLRNSCDYRSINDHGEALRLALTDGVSRHGVNIGRGSGFRPLFIGLANLSASLRFRSGDHALVIDGSNASLMTARGSEAVLGRAVDLRRVRQCPHVAPKLRLSQASAGNRPNFAPEFCIAHAIWRPHFRCARNRPCGILSVSQRPGRLCAALRGPSL
jgi:anti-sigma regulatory factor (Ser/Thr protein kinase)